MFGCICRMQDDRLIKTALKMRKKKKKKMDG